MFPLHSQSSQFPPVELDEATLRDLNEITLRDRVAYAQWCMKEIEQFQAAFPEPIVCQTPLPRFTWEQLERQMTYLAGTPERRAMVANRIASIRRLSQGKPEEMILQELLIEAWVLLDEEPYQPSQEADMT